MNLSNQKNQGGVGGAKLTIVAVLLAIVAVVLTNFYIEMIRREVTEQGFNVYKLTNAMKVGAQLDKKYVQAVAVPSKFESSFRDLGAINDTDLKLYLTDKAPFERPAREGALLVYDMFTAESDRNLDQLIKSGKRWVSLPVNSRTLPGALRVGMFVDIEGSFSVGSALPATLPVMERVEVKALGTRAILDNQDTSRRTSARRYQTITIEVPPEDATTLSMVQQLLVGEFELHLRNPADELRPKIPEGGINPLIVDMVIRRQRMPGPATTPQRFPDR